MKYLKWKENLSNKIFDINKNIFIKFRENKKTMMIALIIVLGVIYSLGFGAISVKLSSAMNYSATADSTHVADNNTMDSYLDELINEKNGSRYAGRVWADKTVFAYNSPSTPVFNGKTLQLDLDTDGIEKAVSTNEDFLHVFSTLGSSQVVNKYPPTPIDLMLVIDVSSSMLSGDDSNSRISRVVKSADNLITQLMQMNPYNRVGIVLFDDNAYTMVPLDHYEPANGYYDENTCKNCGFIDTNTYDIKENEDNKYPMSIKEDGSLTLGNNFVDSDGVTRYHEYSNSTYEGHDDIHYNFLSVRGGWLSLEDNKRDTIDNEAYYGGTLTKYKKGDGTFGNGRVVSFKYKKSTAYTNADPMKGMHASTDKEYNTSRVNGYYEGEVPAEYQNHVAFELESVSSDTVVLSQVTEGGTNVQGGYYLGLRTLAEAKNTYVNYEDEEYEDTSRVPVFVLLSDGESNTSSDYSTWWMPGAGVGIDTQNTFATNSSFNSLDNKSYPLFEEPYDNWSGTQTSTSTLRAIKPLMTAAYWKKMADTNYDNKLQFYTIGLGLNNGISKLCLDPTNFLTENAYENEKNVNSKTAIRNVLDLTNAYVKGKNPRYYSMKSDYTRSNDYTFFHPGNLKTGLNEGAYAYKKEKFTKTSPNIESENANYFYRFYSVAVSDKDIPITVNESDDDYKDINKVAYYKKDEYKNEDSDIKGYTPIGRRSSTESDIKKDAYNPKIASSNEPTFEKEGVYSRGDFAKVDINKEDLYYTDSYFDAGNENIESIFDDILELIKGSVFTPISGSNDIGVEDSLTYFDPIGEYMEVKNNAITIDNKTYDLALLLFGEMHGLNRTGVYDYNFNIKHLTNGSFKTGWYDNESGDYVSDAKPSVSDGEDVWDKYTYYVNGETVRNYIPNLNLDSNGEVTDQQKNTVYTLYGFTDLKYDAKTGKEVSYLNPCYTVKDGDPDSKNVEYKLSDIHVWTEYTGDFLDQTSGSAVDLGYDDALYVNIPTGALPLQVATIDMNKDENGKMSYQTNLDKHKESTPLRVFYGVGVDDSIKDSSGKIDVTKLSSEYISKHRDSDGDIYLYSNYYSGNTYTGYVSDGSLNGGTTRGDANFSFSFSSDNRFYSYQKPLTIYEMNPTDGKYYHEIKFENDKQYKDFIGTGDFSTNKHSPATTIDSGKWYYVVLDYFTEDGDMAHVAVARLGKEFGSGIAGDNVSFGEYLIWYNPKDGSTVAYTYNEKDSDGNDVVKVTPRPGVDPETGESDYVIATKIGGLRVGDMAQSSKDKANDGNKTNTSKTYYLPIISTNSEGSKNVIINGYLGNNGRLRIPNSILSVTKEVEAIGGKTNKEFDFELTIPGFVGQKDAIRVVKNPNTNKWQLRIRTIDVVTDNNGFLQTVDNNIARFNRDGKLMPANADEEKQKEYIYYMYVEGEGTTLVDSKLRLYTSEEAKEELGDIVPGGVSVKTIEDGSINNGLMEFSINKVYLIDSSTVGESWSFTGSDLFKENFVISTLNSTETSLVDQISSPYATKTSYLNTTLNFDENNKALFKLKDKEGLILLGLDGSLNSEYTVVEKTEDDKSIKTDDNDSKGHYRFSRVYGEASDETIDSTDTLQTGVVGDSGEYHYINTYRALNDLVITKTLKGADALKDADKDWTFNIELTLPEGENLTSTLEYTYVVKPIESDDTVEGETNTLNLTLKDGVYKGSITLKGGEEATILGLVSGTKWTVEEKEASKDGYTTEVTGSGENVLDEAGEVVVGSMEGYIKEGNRVDFVNTNFSEHDIQISKTVLGNTGETGKEWEFKVKLTPAEGVVLADSYNYFVTGEGIDETLKREMKLEEKTDDDNNVYYEGVVSIAHGQVATIKDLPEGTTYKVVETLANKDGYTTDVTGNTEGILETDSNPQISFVNTRDSRHDLVIKKEVTGGFGDQSKDWIFTVTLTPPSHIKDFAKTYTTYVVTGSGIDGEEIRKLELERNVGDNGKVYYEGTITITSGQTATIKDLPGGCEYSVLENEHDEDDYNTTITEGKKVSDGKAGGVLTASDYSEEAVVESVKFVNHKDSLHNLVIEKEVDGFSPDTEKLWTFNIEFTGTELNNIKYTITGESLEKDLELTGSNKSYTATVSIRHGQKVIIKNLPEGTHYKVVEKEANQDGYMTEVTNGAGVPATGEGDLPSSATPVTVTVSYKNIRLDANTLSITKQVMGNDKSIDKDKEWEFNLEFRRILDDGIKLSDTYKYVVTGSEISTDGEERELELVESNGVYKSKNPIKLKDGQTAIIKDLPVGTHYTVSEVGASLDGTANRDGYYTYYEGDTEGDISGDAAAVVKYINYNPAELNLSLSKKVAGKIADEAKLFTFEVTLEHENEHVTLADSYDYYGFDLNGLPISGSVSFKKQNKPDDEGSYIYVGEVNLKHGDKITIAGIPEGTHYSVKEKNIGDYIGMTKDNAEGWIRENNHSVGFVNWLLEDFDLTIKKTIKGNLAENNRDWTFNIVLTSPEAKDLGDGEYTYIKNDKEYDLELSKNDSGNYEATILLKGGEEATIKNLPEGTKYVVSEEEANEDGYITTDSFNTDGKLYDDKDTLVEFTNWRFSRHNLIIEKQLKGDNTENDREWTFEVVLTPTDDVIFDTSYSYVKNNGDKGTISFTENEDKTYLGTVKLKGGEEITIEGIPFGTAYEVKEIEANKDGYSTTSTDAKGAISNEKQDDYEVLFVNSRNNNVLEVGRILPDDVISNPYTADGILKYFLTLIVATILGFAIVIREYAFKK